jgi:transcription initiation factor TFIIIB Brf1 subunit/transcription initiation factor TFIIB
MAGLGLEKSSDESLRALQFILEAWEEGADAGASPELMAYAALYTALTDLVCSYGEQHVSTLVDGLRGRILGGEFTMCARTQ